MDIELRKIKPNPEQPRTEFDEESLQELAQSIKENGLIQPVVVEISADGESFVLHAGERRWRAAQIAGLDAIPAIVVDPVDAADRLTRALVENVQREDMSPLDVAKAYRRMHDELGLSDQQIADKVGKSRSSIANSRRLLDLPDEVQELFNEPHVSARTMMGLLPIYQLPESTLALVQDRYDGPTRLLGDIRRGDVTSSEQVRDRVKSLLNACTSPLDDAPFPTDHEFQRDDLQSARCDDCDQRVQLGRQWRCPFKDCYTAKSQQWEEDILEAAGQIYGIPVLPDDAAWNEFSTFYGEKDIVQGIVDQGCANLRLRIVRWSGSAEYRLPDYPQISVVCFHGTDDSKQCTCLQQARAERPDLVEDPERAQCQRNLAQYQRLVSVCGRVIGADLAQQNDQAWRWMLAMLPYVDAREDWGFNRICQALAESALDYVLPYDARQDPDLALSQIGDVFQALNLAMPDLSPAADLQRRLDRIRGWIDANIHHNDGAEPPALEAIKGNLANLEQLTADVDALTGADVGLHDPQFDGVLIQLAEAWETLDTLKHQLETDSRQPVRAQTPQEEPA